MNREEHDYKRHMSEELLDFFGNPIGESDRLARPFNLFGGSSPGIQMCVVTSIREGRIYLDESKVALRYPGRCINISYLVSH